MKIKAIWQTDKSEQVNYSGFHGQNPITQWPGLNRHDTATWHVTDAFKTMIKKVKNRARPAIIWLEGVCWVPRAFRKKENTTTSLVKEVMSIRIAGASVIMVKIKMIWSKAETSPGSLPLSIPIFNEGKRKSAAKALLVNKMLISRKDARKNRMCDLRSIKLLFPFLVIIIKTWFRYFWIL